MRQLINKREQHVSETLRGFDRVRHRGTIRMVASAAGLTGWLNDRRGLWKQFKDASLGLTETEISSVPGRAQVAQYEDSRKAGMKTDELIQLNPR